MGKFTSKLGKRKGPQTAADLLEEVDRSIDAFMRRPDGRVALRLVDSVARHLDAAAHEAPDAARWACAAGCNFCCHMPVLATVPELARVAAAIRERPDAADIHARVRSNAETIDGLDDEEALFTTVLRCALLDANGRCSVYAARPLVCRGHVSFSREVCEAAHVDPHTDLPAATDPQMQQARTNADTHVTGSLIAVGLDPNGYELNQGLARMLELDGDGWLDPNAFVGCRTVSDRVAFVEAVQALIAESDQ